MPSSIQEEIDRIQHNYYFKFDVLDSIDDIDAILKNKEITKEERLKATILKNEIINVLTTLGDEKGSLEIGMQLAQEVMKESKDLGDEILILDSQMNLCNNYFSNNKWQELEKPLKEFLSSFEELKPSTDFHYLKRKGFYFIFKGVLPFIKIYTGEGTTDEEIEKGFQVWIEGEKFSEKNNLPYFQTAFLLNIGSIQTNRGELDLALETRQKMVKISKDIGSKLGYAFYLHYLAWAYFNKNEYKKFYEISKERLIIAEELAVKGMIAGSYYNLGIYYLTTGEYDEALDQYKQSLEIYQNMQNENSIAFLQKDCGYVYYLKGELDRALEFYMKAFPVLKENKPQGWFGILSDFAAVYLQKGELDRALEHLDQLMTIHKGFQNQFGISRVLSEQGMIFWQRGMKEQALSYIQESLEMREKIGNKPYIAASLSYLVQFNVELNNIEAARKYFESLELINKETKINEVSQNCKFAEALILKRTSDLRDRMKAEVLFEQLIEEDISYSLLVQVLLNLSDLLIVEMKETDDAKVLEKIYKYVNKLQGMAEKNNSHLLHVETIRLNAQLALLEFDIDNARALLLKALNLAQENNFERLVLDLLQQQEKLTKQSIELRNLEKTSSTISQRMSVIEINDTVSSIKRTSITETVKKEEEVSKKLFSIQI